MIKNIFKVAALSAAIFSMTACDNVRAKAFGGTMTVQIEQDQKFVNCSWKSSKDSGTSLWLLTRARKEGEQPETYKYFEKSTLGLLEGTVVIQEK
jgi:hypothetical protein